MKRIIKNHQHEIHLVTQRCIIVLVMMLILIGLLLGRLSFLQLIKQDLYTTLSNKNSLDLVPIEPTRGLIYDRNGVLLAENIPVFSLDIIPYKVDNLHQTLAEISKIIPLSDTDLAQFQKELKQHRRFDEIPLKLKLSEKEVAIFAENQYRFPGVLIKARLIRHYPFGPAFSHALGYVGRINNDELDEIDEANYSATNYIGKLGIEKYYEEELHGTVGYEQQEMDASGEIVRILSQIKPVPGKNLYLTLDSELQKIAEKALEGYRGAVVVVQPSTGQILALVSQPSYQPDLFVAGISNHDFQELQQSPDRPLYNRALRGLYPLASTIKPYVALQGLDNGTTNLDYTIYDPGWYELPRSGHLFHDWKKHGHGTVNLTKAIVNSCDTYFYDLAHKMGIGPIDDILERFGFGDLTGIDMEEEISGTIASPKWKRRVKGQPWYEGDTIISAIGQGYMQATPLQLAMAVSTLANRGERFTPHLLLLQQEPGQKEEPALNMPIEPVILAHPENWKIIIDAMQEVIHSPQGTGYLHFGKVDAYTVAGKTGTAQVYSKNQNDYEQGEPQLNLPEHLRDHSLFIAFAPVDHPQIALAVVAENSSIAATVARKVMDFYLLDPKKGNLPHELH